MNSNSVPLADVLPWGDNIPTGGRTILIYDSAETNGRFLLHTLASQFVKNSCTSNSSKIQRSNNNNNYYNTVERSKSITQQQPFVKDTTINANSTSIMHRGDDDHNKVFWVACGSLTEKHIFAALKKIGCDIPSSLFSAKSPKQSSKQHSCVQVINVMLELDEMFQNTNNNFHLEAENDDKYNHETYIKTIYQRIQAWIKGEESKRPSSSSSSSSNHHLLILDNVALLSAFFGAPLTQVLIQKLRSLIRQTNNNNNNGCLTILCSHDIDQELYIAKTAEEKQNTSVSGGKRAQYIGSGGRGTYLNSKDFSILEQNALYELEHGGEGLEGGVVTSTTWERQLVELADGIIDVVPLASGFARDVHGRLIFTERPGGLGWRGDCPVTTESSQRVEHANLATKTVSKTSKQKNAMKYTNLESSNDSQLFSSKIVNYCCTESGVRAIRLREVK